MDGDLVTIEDTAPLSVLLCSIPGDLRPRINQSQIHRAPFITALIFVRAFALYNADTDSILT